MQSNVKTLVWLVAAVSVLMVGYYNRGWAGFMLVLGAVVFFILLHLTRVMKILKVASGTPKGRISSAIMLNSKLKQGMTLLQVVQLTRAIGEVQGDPNAPQVCHRWTDPGGAWVDAVFVNSKLQNWQFGRTENPVETSPESREAT
ncbi:glycerate kinase [Lampropedia puyangensis]|uniref:Glycerate kinase n=1 Tax=Lampropedia puyangensis TaxID=1330072 RepID=A0A4S8F350_9BURK|nr:glycerate kinase [Lampropedia puyangensis]THU01467.1 glycerate kinase [Lampropedia puyangensis]